VTATNVETGQPRVFKREEITVDVLLASGCLPFVFQAVEIDGVPYWDGGYMGNPSIWPLFYNSPSGDVLLVQINPVMRKGTPKRSLDIINRQNEISFNSSLIAEMRAIHFVRQLIEQGRLDEKHYRHVNMHMIAPPDGVHEMTADSKLNASWQFFTFLHQLGREEAEGWLKKNKKMIGVDSTFDIAKTFLTKPTRAHRTGTQIVQKVNSDA
jgi:NTE family protein